MFSVAIEGVIFIVMSSLDIRRVIFKIFPAWMMKATMAGAGMFLAFIGLQSGKGIDIIRDHPAVLVDLVEELPEDREIDNYLANFRKWLDDFEEHNANFQPWLRELGACIETLGQQLHSRQLAKYLGNFRKLLRKDEKIAADKLLGELAKYNKTFQWLRELEKYCEELTKIDRQQKAKVHSKFRKVQLAKVHYKLRNENEKNNELEKNFESMIFKKKLVALLPDRHFALAAPFRFFGYKAWKEFREASIEIIFYKMMRDKELRHQLRREQLDHKAFWSGSFKALRLSSFEESSFADSSLEEETFEEGSFEQSSLEDSSFSDSSFEDSSLEENSFEDSSFSDSSFADSSFEENSFEDSSFSDSSFADSSFEENSFEDSSFEEN